MRGFLVGSFALIVLEVFVSGKGPDKAAGLLGWIGDALDRVISADSPGIPQSKTAAKTAATDKKTDSDNVSTVPKSKTGVVALNA